MAKKTLKDYDPEEVWKLERRFMLKQIEINPHYKIQLEKGIEHIAGALNARQEALRYRNNSNEMGTQEFYLWRKENPLSVRAELHLALIEQEYAENKAKPILEHYEKFNKNRKQGRVGESQKHVNQLVITYPDLTAKELMRKADKNIIGDMESTTFANKVSAARNKKNSLLG